MLPQYEIPLAACELHLSFRPCAAFSDVEAAHLARRTYNEVVGQISFDPASAAKQIRIWRELKYGMFIHYGLSTFVGDDMANGDNPATAYAPTHLDVDQWVRTARDAGMKYVVLTAKHVSGFCLWDSKVIWKGKEFDYDVAASSDTTDVVAEFIAACKKYGLWPGIYYCTMDLCHSMREITWNPKLPALSDEYFTLMKDHLRELHTEHPDIAIQWLDIPRHLTNGQRSELYNLIRSLNPDCVIMFNYGTESQDIKGSFTIEKVLDVSWPTDVLNSEVTMLKEPFQTCQEFNGKTYELGYEHCISIAEEWFWKPDESLKSVAELYTMYREVMRLNGNFLLNVPPDKTGLIPVTSVKRLMELRDELDKSK